MIRSDGNIVRPIADVGGEAVAQMMCVVGSNQGGEDNPSWERNLSLALQLRKSINDEYINLCRPVYLKSSTYNQEISKYSLLLEIGSIGNSLEEALSCTQIVGEALSELIK